MNRQLKLFIKKSKKRIYKPSFYIVLSKLLKEYFNEHKEIIKYLIYVPNPFLIKEKGFFR